MKKLERGGKISQISKNNKVDGGYQSASIHQFTSMWSTCDFISCDFPAGETQHRLDLLFNQQQWKWSPSNGETAWWGREPCHPWPDLLSPPTPRPPGQRLAWGRRIESIRWTMWVKRGLSREDPPKKTNQQRLDCQGQAASWPQVQMGPCSFYFYFSYLGFFFFTNEMIVSIKFLWSYYHLLIGITSKGSCVFISEAEYKNEGQENTYFSRTWRTKSLSVRWFSYVH